jgi:Beta-lactamase class D
LRISPDEQIEFLKKLYQNKLTFSQRSIDIVKRIMIYDQTDDYVLRAKTGWGIRSKNNIGWFVGYVESKNNVYFFATNLETKHPEEGYSSRIKITYNILKYLGIII